MSQHADHVIELYQRHALTWNEDRLRTLIEKQWLDRFLRCCPPNASVLDLGCGMGEPIAGYLIKQSCQITGVDSAATLIELCKSRFPQHRWLVADMRYVNVDEQFQGILAWDSFFHLNYTDQRRMFPIFGRLALPEAPLMFTSGPAHGEAIGEYQNEPLYHASLSPEEYGELLQTHGFRVIDHVAEDPSCGYRTVWLAQKQASLD